MDQRNVHGRFDISGHLVHRIGANHQAIGSAAFDVSSGGNHSGGCRGPVTRCLMGFDFCKVERPQEQLCRMQPAQSLASHAVEQLVVDNGALPAHTAN